MVLIFFFSHVTECTKSEIKKLTNVIKNFIKLLHQYTRDKVLFYNIQKVDQDLFILNISSEFRNFAICQTKRNLNPVLLTSLVILT